MIALNRDESLDEPWEYFRREHCNSGPPPPASGEGKVGPLWVTSLHSPCNSYMIYILLI